MRLALISIGLAVVGGGDIKLYSGWQNPNCRATNTVFKEYSEKIFKKNNVEISGMDTLSYLKRKVFTGAAARL